MLPGILEEATTAFSMNWTEEYTSGRGRAGGGDGGGW